MGADKLTWLLIIAKGVHIYFYLSTKYSLSRANKPYLNTGSEALPGPKRVHIYFYFYSFLTFF
jgi:hypothetical protein